MDEQFRPFVGQKVLQLSLRRVFFDDDRALRDDVSGIHSLVNFHNRDPSLGVPVNEGMGDGGCTPIVGEK